MSADEKVAEAKAELYKGITDLVRQLYNAAELAVEALSLEVEDMKKESTRR